VEAGLVNRLSRLEGQVRGVRKMLADHKSCDEILVQVAAIKQAVNGVAVELLQGHLDSCVADNIRDGVAEAALKSLRGALTHVLRHG
jgi:DNA-binding FrmR family transcriptional regulator